MCMANAKSEQDAMLADTRDEFVVYKRLGVDDRGQLNGPHNPMDKSWRPGTIKSEERCDRRVTAATNDGQQVTYGIHVHRTKEDASKILRESPSGHNGDIVVALTAKKKDLLGATAARAVFRKVRFGRAEFAKAKEAVEKILAKRILDKEKEEKELAAYKARCEREDAREEIRTARAQIRCLKKEIREYEKNIKNNTKFLAAKESPGK